MLNSAAGVTFPRSVEPPITTIRSSGTSGCASSRAATLVNGPVATSVTGEGWLARISCMKPTASVDTTGTVGSPNDGPSIPDSP
jgi:hypothetical protein